MTTRIWCLGCALCVATGCAGLAPQQLGQVAGSVAGAALVPGIGAPVGGLIGLLAGMIVQKRVDQVTETRERVTLGQQLTSPPPESTALLQTPPVGTPTRVWVDETWHDGRVAAGSFEERYIP